LNLKITKGTDDKTEVAEGETPEVEEEEQKVAKEEKKSKKALKKKVPTQTKPKAKKGEKKK